MQGQVIPVKIEDWTKYKSKKLLIHQPGKVGDIICCLPIAEHYSKQGWVVEWLCPNQYHSLFNYVDYAKPVATQDNQYDKIIDLSFGIITNSDVHRLWIRQKNRLKSFVELKYQIAGVPLLALRNLNYTRNHELENAIFNHLGLDNGGDYILTPNSKNRPAGAGSRSPREKEYGYAKILKKDFNGSITVKGENFDIGKDFITNNL